MRLVSKKCSFIWKFTGQTLENEHFSSVFEVFDPLGFYAGRIFASFWLSNAFKASDEGGTGSRGNFSFIYVQLRCKLFCKFLAHEWKFTGRTLEN